MSKFYVEAENLCRRFPAPGKDSTQLTVFEGINFGIQEGEFISCIGHSGCGKSTILNILAGLDSPSDGYVYLRGKEIVGPGLERAVVFQSHGLLPWLTALQNVAFAVKARWPDWSRSQVRAHSVQYLEMVGLGGAYERKPHQLSGGMKQRVGIARAFALQSKLLLMDEPFGALDALTRGSIQDELVRICGETGQTIFMITHDVDEAIILSDRIFLMTNGPHACVAEALRVDLPRPRDRRQIIHHPRYYKIRNHLVDFLVSRSKELAGKGALLAKEAHAQGTGRWFPPDVMAS